MIMTTPETLDIPRSSYFEVKKNGHGVQWTLPENATSFGQSFEIHESDVFPEANYVSRKVLRAKDYSLLVQGEPGSGKSHLVQDIMWACADANNAPALTISLHIAGGHQQGGSNIRQYVEEFSRRLNGKRGLVIFDNLDFLGYKGSNRRLGRTREFAQQTADLVGAVVSEDNLAVLGIIHDKEWRHGRWTWDDTEINHHANRALNAFSEPPYHFKGRLSTDGLVKTMEMSGHSRQVAEKFVGQLVLDGKADFFHARHVDPIRYFSDPKAAIAQANQGREDRKSTTRSRTNT